MAYAPIVNTCPHCGAENLSFEIVGFSRRSTDNNREKVNAHLLCPKCLEPCSVILAKARNPNARMLEMSELAASAEKALKSVDQHKLWSVTKMLPERPAILAPQFLPEAVERNFIRGCEQLRRNNFEGSAIHLRKALELATNAIAKEKDISANNLASRIKKLANEGFLTKDMEDWSHEIRLIGNDAAHEEAEPTKHDVEDIKSFGEILLLYLFTLPSKLKNQRKRRHDEHDSNRRI